MILAAAFAVAVGLALTACGASDRPVVYVSEADGNPDVYTLEPESGQVMAVRRGPESQFGPVWSPDGKSVALVAQNGDNRNVILVSLEGEGAVAEVAPREGAAAGNEGAPKWHPDGQQLAYVSDAAGQPDVYVYALPNDTRGGNSTRITSTEDREVLGDWSPDGNWLVFSRQGGGDAQGLWLRNPAGVNLLRLTSGSDSGPQWSPDGDVIAFVRDDLGNKDIYLVRPEDGEDWRGEVEIERWANSSEEDHSPAWAPNGDTLAFVSAREGNSEIYVGDAGEDDPPIRLTFNEAKDTAPVWSPDGERIAFVSDLFGATEILVMNADGTGQQRITHNDSNDHSPDW